LPPFPPVSPIGLTKEEWEEIFENKKGLSNKRKQEEIEWHNDRFGADRFSKGKGPGTDKPEWQIKPTYIMNYFGVPETRVRTTIQQVEDHLSEKFTVSLLNKKGHRYQRRLAENKVFIEERIYNELVVNITDNYQANSDITECEDTHFTLFNEFGIQCVDENTDDISYYLEYMERNIIYYEVILADNLGPFLTDSDRLFCTQGINDQIQISSLVRISSYTNKRYATVICYPDRREEDPKTSRSKSSFTDVSIKWLNGGANGIIYTLR
jgi:hypothetical protein